MNSKFFSLVPFDAWLVVESVVESVVEFIFSTWVVLKNTVFFPLDFFSVVANDGLVSKLHRRLFLALDGKVFIFDESRALFGRFFAHGT